MKTDPPNVLIRRHSRLFRCSALVWAAVFTLFGVRSAYADAECAHHTGHVAHAAAEAGSAHGHHAHGASGSEHSHHDHPTADAVADPHHETDAGPCLCIEACHLAGVHGLPGWVHAAPPTQASEYLGVSAATSARSDSARDQYLLPFATAPPSDR